MARHTQHWGEAQTTDVLADGITYYTTAGHGGFEVSARRLAAMPFYLRRCSFTHDQAFEEDCSWCAVVVTWPEVARDLRELEAAHSTLRGAYPEAWLAYLADQRTMDKNNARAVALRQGEAVAA